MSCAVRIIHSDCLAALSEMPADSVDAIVTDPPYGLSFMGRKWDYDVPSVEIWAECLRVLKPGGHLLAFAGTRTQHRMAVRIEDAGFEIRDMICWTYASGFPKSHNLDNLRGKQVCGCAVPYAHDRAESTTKHDMRPVRVGDVPQTEPSGEERWQVLQSGVQEQGAPVAGRTELSAAEDGRGQPSLEGWGDASQEARELRSSALHAGTSLGRADGSGGWLRDGASPCDGGVVRLPVDSDGVRSPRGPQPAEQHKAEPRTVAGQPKSQAGGAWPVCRGCGLPVLPKGLGTALKPALEPITVARKPLAGTVAENVLAHGTGALNIDGCRVEPTGESRERVGEASQDSRYTESGGTNFAATPGVRGGDPSGRWPANLIHDGSDEVVALLPAQAGAAAPVKGTESSRASVGRVTGERERVAGAFHADTGSAARFFYCAKASKRDRNSGLNGVDLVIIEPVANAKGEKWESEDHQVRLLVDTGASPPRVTAVFGAQCRSVNEWNTLLFGSARTAPFQQASTFTTATATSSTTGLTTLSYFQRLLTSGNTQAANCATTDGGNPAESAGRGTTSITTTGESMASVLGAELAACATLWRTSASAWVSSHPTVKPTDLMRYLCRLVTPPGGLVLDPFAGSGSTGKAAVLEGFRFIGVEREAEYVEIARARVMSAASGQPDLFEAQA